MRAPRWALALLLALTTSACGGGEFGDQCESNDDCNEPLTCPRDGVYRDRCTLLCTDSDECDDRFGNAFCYREGVCVEQCMTRADCPAGLHCDTDGVPGFCGH